MRNKFYNLKTFIGIGVWRYFWASVALGVFWFAIESSFVFVLQGFLFSIGLLQRSQVFLPKWYPTTLGASVMMLVLFGVARAAVFMMKNHFAVVTQALFTCEQRSRLLSFFLKNAGTLSSKNMIATFSEITTQAGVVIYYFSNLINSLIAALLFFVFGLYLTPIEMLIGIGLLLLFLFPMKYISNKINTYGEGLIEEWEKLSESLLRGIRNYFFLTVYNQINSEIKKGHDSLNNYNSYYFKYSMVSSFVGAFPLLLGVSILSFITYVSITYLNTDSMRLVSFFYLFIRLAQTASESNLTLSNLKLNLPGFRVLYGWSLRSANSDLIIDKTPWDIDGENIKIELERVSLKFGQSPFLFKDISLKVETGDVLVVKGESGSGKSSLLSLILSINSPTAGKVLINNISTSEFKINLENMLGYVGPEPFIVQGSIKENLHYGNNKLIPEDETWLALEVVELASVIRGLPLQLEEKINEVSQLSTGQKQRLSLARALLRKPKLLVLDEATANLDQETEKKIIENTKKIIEKCLTIVVTHKDSFDSVATKVLDLNLIKKELQ